MKQAISDARHAVSTAVVFPEAKAQVDVFDNGLSILRLSIPLDVEHTSMIVGRWRVDKWAETRRGTAVRLSDGSAVLLTRSGISELLSSSRPSIIARFRDWFAERTGRV